jgi:hypothetical protein
LIRRLEFACVNTAAFPRIRTLSELGVQPKLHANLCCRQSVLRLLITAIAMDKFVLERKGDQLATRVRLVGERLDSHCDIRCSATLVD